MNQLFFQFLSITIANHSFVAVVVSFLTIKKIDENMDYLEATRYYLQAMTYYLENLKRIYFYLTLWIIYKNMFLFPFSSCRYLSVQYL